MKLTSIAVLAVFLTSAAHGAEKPSQAFLKKAIEGNFAEIQMGQLALQKGHSDNLKKFGQMLADDHSAANQKAIGAAQSMGVNPPDGPNAKQKADYDKMSKMSGLQFDRDFATHMVADHEKDIAEYKKAAKQADAAGDYAKGQLDVLQKTSWYRDVAAVQQVVKALRSRRKLCMKDLALNSAASCDWADALRNGNLQRAWEISDQSLREYCLSGAIKHTGERHFQRIWRGEDLRNKRVLVRCYHGLGDTIQFIRFARALRTIARQVLVWGQPELFSLLRQVDGVDEVFPLHDGTPEFPYDVDIEVMELAHALRVTPEFVSSRVPYLLLDGSELRPPASPASPIKIGLVWEVGNWDRRRCVPPHMLAALRAEPGIRLFSLQQGPGRRRAATIPAEDIAAPDIESLAATIMTLDLIVTVDTMVAHLAGALGTPVWTMLHADCDWRWPKTARRSIWYPTMTLFHQTKAGEWGNVIEQIADELKRYRMPGVR